MASIGLKYSVYSPLTEDEVAGTYSYGVGKRGRKLIKADIKLNLSDSKLYAEDNVGESLKEFIDGTMTINQDELNNTMRKDLLGNTTESITVNGETIDELSSKETDTAPYVGYGYIQPKIIDKVRQYRAVWFTKVQFGESDESGETKGQSIVWQTPSVIGTIMRRIDGAWKKEITTLSLDTAIAWLKSKANIPPITTLSTLLIGALILTPTFDRDVITYAAGTTNASDIILATATDTAATVAILVGETPVVNGQAAIWSAGTNTVTVTVTNGTETKTYTVTVTKS